MAFRSGVRSFLLYDGNDEEVVRNYFHQGMQAVEVKDSRVAIWNKWEQDLTIYGPLTNYLVRYRGDPVPEASIIELGRIAAHPGPVPIDYLRRAFQERLRDRGDLATDRISPEDIVDCWTILSQLPLATLPVCLGIPVRQLINVAGPNTFEGNEALNRLRGQYHVLDDAWRVQTEQQQRSLALTRFVRERNDQLILEHQRLEERMREAQVRTRDLLVQVQQVKQAVQQRPPREPVQHGQIQHQQHIHRAPARALAAHGPRELLPQAPAIQPAIRTAIRRAPVNAIPPVGATRSANTLPLTDIQPSLREKHNVQRPASTRDRGITDVIQILQQTIQQRQLEQGVQNEQVERVPTLNRESPRNGPRGTKRRATEAELDDEVTAVEDGDEEDSDDDSKDED